MRLFHAPLNKRRLLLGSLLVFLAGLAYPMVYEPLIAPLLETDQEYRERCREHKKVWGVQAAS